MLIIHFTCIYLFVADSTNYREIAISSVFSKVVDNIILNKYSDLLSTSKLQFGFKCGHSTNMCTMILKETVSYYIHNGSSVYCTFLDATKAFDRINYRQLSMFYFKEKFQAS